MNKYEQIMQTLEERAASLFPDRKARSASASETVYDDEVEHGFRLPYSSDWKPIGAPWK